MMWPQCWSLIVGWHKCAILPFLQQCCVHLGICCYIMACVALAQFALPHMPCLAYVAGGVVCCHFLPPTSQVQGMVQPCASGAMFLAPGVLTHCGLSCHVTWASRDICVQSYCLIQRLKSLLELDFKSCSSCCTC